MREPGGPDLWTLFEGARAAFQHASAEKKGLQESLHSLPHQRHKIIGPPQKLFRAQITAL